MSHEGPITWRQEDTERWLGLSEQRERSLRPVLEVLLAAAAPRAGERALDVGCGTGPTTSALADAVLPAGEVVGLDLAPELLEVARRRERRAGVRWVAGDATTVDLPVAHFDLVLSRFGVMFFADPPAAFAHLADLTRPGGRLVVSVWPSRDEVAAFMLGYGVAREALDRAGVGYDEPPPDRGPFSLGDEERARRLLASAGWDRVEVDTVERPYAVALPGADLLDAARGLLGSGHAAVLLEDAPDEVADDAAHHLAARLAELRTDAGVLVDTAVRVVRAVRSESAS